MCKIVAQVFFTLALAATTVSPVFHSPRAEAALDEADTIVSVVSAFYTKYLKLNMSVDLLDWLRRQPEADAAFVEEIEKLFKEVENSEEGYLGYDPVLMAQDFPERMQYDRPVVDGASAELIAYTLWGEGSKSPLCVSLIKREGAWRITGVLDMRDEEAKACGGMEPGAGGDGVNESPTGSNGDDDLTNAQVQINYAVDGAIDQYESFNKYVHEEDGAWLIITTDKAINNLMFIKVGVHFLEDDALLFLEYVEKDIGYLMPDKPFMVKTYSSYGTLPRYGISFTDTNNLERYFFIAESGMDGTLSLIEFENIDVKDFRDR